MSLGHRWQFLFITDLPTLQSHCGWANIITLQDATPIKLFLVRSDLEGQHYRIIMGYLSDEKAPKTYVMVKFLFIVSQVYQPFLQKLQAMIPLVGDLHMDSGDLVVIPSTQLPARTAENLADCKINDLNVRSKHLPFMEDLRDDMKNVRSKQIRKDTKLEIRDAIVSGISYL